MKNVLLQAAIKLNEVYRRKTRWRWAVRSLTMVVVFCTTYALILPAITMVSSPECGMEEHVHTESCYTQQEVLTPACEFAANDVQVHSHTAECFNEDGALICTLLEVEEHTHNESCMAASGQMEQVLTCQIRQHTHDDVCYLLVKEEEYTYTCGAAEHIHSEKCRDEAGQTVCTIPEHTHEAVCIVPDLDPGADVESAEQWAQETGKLELSGNWPSDVLRVAKSQLGYAESKRNVVLEDGVLKGYTRYGAWAGQPYGDWDAMFVSFCLNYAGVEGFPANTAADSWINVLSATGFYADKSAYDPKPGDLIFFRTAERKEGAAEDELGEDAFVFSKRVALVTEVTAAAETGAVTIEAIEGDTYRQVMYVTYEEADPRVLGYGILPNNPLSDEECAQADEFAALIAALPGADETEAAFDQLNAAGDKNGFEALRQELVARMEALLGKYEALSGLQKVRVGALTRLYDLQTVCGGAAWKRLPALDGDGAVVTELITGEAEVISGAPAAQAEELEENRRRNTVTNGDRIRYPFTVKAISYHDDINYSEGRVKVEFLLPLDGDRAYFDVDAMTWLENWGWSCEKRSVNGEEVWCQVLTGYKRMVAEGDTGKVLPGSFTEDVVIHVTEMDRGEKVGVIISAAMEYGTWDGECAAHGVEEKLMAATQVFTQYSVVSAEEQQKFYESYLAQLDGSELTAEAIAQLEEQVYNSYCAGELSEDQFAELHRLLITLSGVDLESVAEPSVGDGWVWLDLAVESYVDAGRVLSTSASFPKVAVTSAMPEKLYSSLGLDSNSQIPDDGWGGENSQGDMIWVSKTIEGTDQENVFDITLQIITKEEVNEVYKEPDMAVVMVMDISNTMTSVFSGETTVTRYSAAMDSAQKFLESFAEATDGVSRVGYVAFNTHGHEVFSMQECSTTAQATALSNTMRAKTKKIMDDAAAKADNGKYSSSRDRFTNIEAGLAMAADMLEDVTNRHKYIIFLSDGFPTTYMTASTSGGYKGYDPYTSSGSNGSNGVFYDRVMGHHCDYGTSYSDTAAIKARQKAVSLKNQGINIFSIGVDVEGQNIWEYHWDSQLRLKTASTVERRQNADYYNNNGYEIGTLHSDITKYSTTYNSSTNKIDLTKLPASAKKAMSQDFKDWLGGGKTWGIGSGYYYDSTDQAELEAAYGEIFEQILVINAESSHLDWVATDPMPGMGVHELETIEFVGFWDMWNDPTALVSSLEGESQDSSLYYNTATFNTENNTISWDLKDSGYQSVSMGSNKNFQCALKYRVRLMNEESGFLEKSNYDTNDVTSLTYRVIEVVDSVTQVSDRKSIDFPIPKVFGYLAELNFKKVNALGEPLAGAKFALTHDTASCGTCRGDGKGHVDVPVYEAVSGADGIVSFTNIPSGHHYKLTETAAPEGYAITDNVYSVVVSYDSLTVTVTDKDGNPLEWTESIVNSGYYELPMTGGAGTSLYTFSGLLMIMAAALIYVFHARRERRKGGTNEIA